MFKKFILFTCCLIFSHLTAYENTFAEQISQNVDRYQIEVTVSGSGTTTVFLLDKEKGTIWSTWSTIYTDFKPWTKLSLPPLPQE